MRDDTNISVIVIYSFAFLFIVFLFLQQASIIKEPTGGAVFDTILDSDTFNTIFSSDIFNTLENIPLTTLMIAGGGIIVLIVGFIIFKKLKKKKNAETQAPQQVQQPQPQLYEKSISDLSKEFNVKGEEGELNRDFDKLFSQSPEPGIVNPPPMMELKEEKGIGEEELKKEESNLDQLKQVLRDLIKKNYTKESIVKYLTKKGYTLMQIRKAIDSINGDSLSSYIKNTLSQGFSKKEIVNALLKAGWSKEDIIKYMQ